MRTIEQSGQFKRDLKREAKGPYRVTLAKDFVRIVDALAKDEPLAEKHRDHARTGGSEGPELPILLAPRISISKPAAYTSQDPLQVWGQFSQRSIDPSRIFLGATMRELTLSLTLSLTWMRSTRVRPRTTR